MTDRIAPLTSPYSPEVATQLATTMPTGMEPIALFRTFAKNLPMAHAMSEWGGYELSKKLSVSMRDREIIIDRTCARCRCEYEWGVHIAFFAERVGLTADEVTSLTHGSADDACWDSHRDQLLIRLADALHDSSDVPDELWAQLSAEFDEAQLLDLTMLCGWYHAISFTANAARVPLELGVPTFGSVSRS